MQISALPKGYDPEEVASSLKENGLEAAGMHVSLERLTDDLPAVLNEARLYKTIDLICPSLPSAYQTADGYKEVRTVLNRLAQEAEGFRISYHNHAFEFETDRRNISTGVFARTH